MDMEADALVALQALKRNAHQIAATYPDLAPFLPLAGMMLHAVHFVEEVTGHDTQSAVASVASTLTPGLPNAPALTDAGSVPIDGGMTGATVDAASDATSSSSTASDVVAAVQAIPDPTVAAAAVTNGSNGSSSSTQPQTAQAAASS